MAPQEQLAPRLAHRVMRGVELNLIGQVASVIIALWLTPLVLRRLGTDGYALYTLIGTLLGYLMLLTPGVPVATVRFSAYHQGREERPRVSGVLRLALLIQLSAALAGGVILFAGRGRFTAWFVQASAGVVSSAPAVLAFAAFAAPFYFLFQLSLNALYGLQRFALYNVMKAAEAACPLAAAAAVLAAGGGLKAVAASFLGVQALLAVSGLLLLRADFAAGKGLPGRAERRDFISFAGKSAWLQIFWLVIYQGDRLIIGGFLTLSDLGFYAVSAAIARKFNAFCGVVSDSVMPMMAELKGRGETERLRNLYLKSTELSLFVVLPVLILSFALVPQFLTLWLGGDFSLRGTWPFRLLVLANLAYQWSTLPANAALSSGAPELTSALQGVKVILLLILWPMLVPRWGISGAAFALLAAEWAICPALLTYVHRRLLGISWRTYLAEACARPCLAASALAAYAFAARPFVGSWSSLLLAGALGALIFYWLGWRLLDEEARSLLRERADSKWKAFKGKV